MTVNVEVLVSFDPYGGLWHAAFKHDDPKYHSFCAEGSDPLQAIRGARHLVEQSQFVNDHFVSSYNEWYNAMDSIEVHLGNPLYAYHWYHGKYSVDSLGVVGGTFTVSVAALGGSTADPIHIIALADRGATWVRPYLTGSVVYTNAVTSGLFSNGQDNGQQAQDEKPKDVDLLDLVSF